MKAVCGVVRLYPMNQQDALQVYLYQVVTSLFFYHLIANGHFPRLHPFVLNDTMERRVSNPARVQK